MSAVKKFFKVEENYKFEVGDLWALLQVVNVALIVFVGFDVGAVFGLAVAVLGLVFDFVVYRRINGVVLHLAVAVLNIFILCM
jgi:hypothetical protein